MNKKVEAGKPRVTQPSISLADLIAKFSDEATCKAYLRDNRWPNGVRCPRCGNEKVYTLKQPFRWQCQSAKCGKNGYRFSVTSGTIFENTKYPLATWFQVAYLMTQSKKGMSALQIHRQIRSGDYRTAWYMCHRLRAAMKNATFEKLVGEVEVDETYIGGKNHNRHANKKTPYKVGGIGSGKIGVIGAISRKGNVVCQMIENTDADTLSTFVEKTVADKVTLVATDSFTGYTDLRHFYPHQTIDHKSGEYVRGQVHTQSIESFWALLKRGVIGTYHQVSKDYLPLYLNEFTFRHNERQNPEIFQRLISSC
jgi:transposase-like protein